MITISTLALLDTLVKITFNCQGAYDNEPAMIENYIFIVMLIILNVASVAVYIYAQRYFTRFYYRQALMNQDIINGTQVDEMKKSIKFMTIFMITLSTLILIRLVVCFVYELAFSYLIIAINNETRNTLTVLIYVTEITLTLMMS